MTMAFCPECGGSVRFGTWPQEGQRLSCGECGARLEVISSQPLELDWVYDEPSYNPEDWQTEMDWEES